MLKVHRPDYVRKNLSQKILDIFELISCHYINIYYNILYDEAKKMKVNGYVTSETEGYRVMLENYLHGLDLKDYQKKNINGLQQSFILYNKSSCIDYNTFIDFVSETFIPANFFICFGNTEKVKIIRHALLQTNRLFISKMLTTYLSIVIDNHENRDNIKFLKREFTDILIHTREEIYQRFIDKKTSTKNSSITYDVLRKTTDEILATAKEELKITLQQKLKAEELCQKMKQLCIEYKLKYENSLKEIDSLNQRISELSAPKEVVQNIDLIGSEYSNYEDTDLIKTYKEASQPFEDYTSYVKKSDDDTFDVISW